MYETFFARHKEAVLLLSGGKDSAACMWLLEPWWDQLRFLWVNPGRPDPGTVEYLNTIRALHPVEEVKGDAVWHEEPFKCCMRNLWLPLARTLFNGEYTACVAGVKAADKHRSPVHVPGAVVEGVSFLFPLWSWSDADVRSFLGDRLPPNYHRGFVTSQDCEGCTAWT